MKKRLKNKKTKTAVIIKSLEDRISKLENELSNLGRAYSINHSQTESFFMFIYEFNFSEEEHKRLSRTLLFECKEVKTKDDLIEKLKAALRPSHQLVIEELMISIRNSNMFPHLTALYFGEGE